MSSKEGNKIAGDKIAALEFLETIPKRVIESFWSQIEIKQTGEHFCILSSPSDSVKKRSLKEANNVRTTEKIEFKVGLPILRLCPTINQHFMMVVALSVW